MKVGQVQQIIGIKLILKLKLLKLRF